MKTRFVAFDKQQLGRVEASALQQSCQSALSVSAGVDGAPICSPADGAADAIVILEWQQWARTMEEVR